MLHATCYMPHKHATFYMLHDTHVTRTCYELHATLGGGKKIKSVINLMANKRCSLKLWPFLRILRSFCLQNGPIEEALPT